MAQIALISIHLQNSGRRTQEVQPLHVTVGRVDTLSNIMIDSVLQKILTDSDAEIQITISPDSQVNVSLMDWKPVSALGVSTTSKDWLVFANSLPPRRNILRRNLSFVLLKKEHFGSF